MKQFSIVPLYSMADHCVSVTVLDQTDYFLHAVRLLNQGRSVGHWRF